MKSLVILISGRGSNMEALFAAVGRGELPVRVAAVISNRPDAKGLETAAAQGVPTAVVDHKAHAGREDFDAALAECIDGYAPDLVVLAGFMRILTEGFVRRYEGRLLNIHPSLLPAFPGLHTHRRALEEGVRIHGCTVHFVTPALDHGPVVVQAAVPVLDGDDEAALAARVLAQEHVVYPLAVRWFAEGRLSLVDGRVRVAAERPQPAPLISP
ncbi:MAG: phosphoribosylglycinamide formyltransferase [Rhodocyclaceae bacterium]|nr:phosphoribosylglycinamide formyltransferase [Rhodocyclaceae bacterium]